MKSCRVSIPVFVVAIIIAGAFSFPSHAGSGVPAVGDEAPAFELPGSDGETYNLSEYRGEKVVILAWFPKAFTGG